jgi:hypothetical protein
MLPRRSSQELRALRKEAQRKRKPVVRVLPSLP